MAIYINEDTSLLIQGIGSYAEAVIPRLKEHGTDVVAGVSPSRQGEEIAGVPVFDTVARALDQKNANTSLVLVPAPYVKEACLEVIEAGIEVVVVITEDVPIHDSLQFIAYARARDTRLIGPNTLGVLSPGKASASLLGGDDSRYTTGSVGVVTRSGTLSMEISGLLSSRGIGQTTVFSVGGDPYVGTPPSIVFQEFDEDPETDAIVYAGEIGGTFEERAAMAIQDIDTPVFATVVGRSAPSGKQMGHAGAISDLEKDKLSILSDAGAFVTETPFTIPELVKDHI
ncbi:succinate--CoA ligase subunit alpha [Natronorubrum sp. FCH18a]|uniref:succinate--CoA ligase subunit alpha n=1 Tax=Natronorubrum sp. FCH18a TaxID=3447018 RepID=UPI003F51667C